MVSDTDSFLTARRMAVDEGILAGGSTGTAVWAALQLAPDLHRDDVVVVLIPDSGRGYLSKLYNDEWMADHGFLRTSGHTVAELLERKGSHAARAYPRAPERDGPSGDDGHERVRRFADRGHPGRASARGRRGRRCRPRAGPHAAGDARPRDPRPLVAEVMGPPLPSVGSGETVDLAVRRLEESPAVIVLDNGHPVGVITRSDALAFLGPGRLAERRAPMSRDDQAPKSNGEGAGREEPGLRHPCHPCRPGARPAHGRRRDPDPPRLHLRPASRRQAPGLRLRAHEQPDTRLARDDDRLARRCRPRLRVLERHGGGRHRVADAEAGRPLADPERRLRRHLPSRRQRLRPHRRQVLARRPAKPRGRPRPRGANETRLVWVETPSNPKLHIIDIEAVAAIAHAKGARCIVDNTFATPVPPTPARVSAPTLSSTRRRSTWGATRTWSADWSPRATRSWRHTSDSSRTRPVRCRARSTAISSSAGSRPSPCGSTASARTHAWSRCTSSPTRPCREVYYPGLAQHPGHDARRRGRCSTSERWSRSRSGEARRPLSTSPAAPVLFTLAESLGAVESLIEHPAQMTHASVDRLRARSRSLAHPAVGRPRVSRGPPRGPRPCARARRPGLDMSLGELAAELPPSVTSAHGRQERRRDRVRHHGRRDHRGRCTGGLPRRAPFS